jgi:hypothetical protein
MYFGPGGLLKYSTVSVVAYQKQLVAARCSVSYEYSPSRSTLVTAGRDSVRFSRPYSSHSGCSYTDVAVL